MMKPMTGDEIRLTIEASRKTLEFDSLRKNSQLQIAALFNQERKIAMIDAMNQFYAYQCGNGPRPQTMPSVAFNPECGKREPNMYYLFKELHKGMPWEVRMDFLIVPIALTLIVFDMANQYFPCPAVSRGMIRLQRFINLITRPKFRPEDSAEESERKRNMYMSGLDECKQDLYDTYCELSIHFAALEDPEKNQVTKAVFATRTDVKKVRTEVCGKTKQLSAIAKRRAFELWEEFRSSPLVAAQKTGPGKTSYADVFYHCKRELIDLGIETATSFEKAVRAYKKGQNRI